MAPATARQRAHAAPGAPPAHRWGAPLPGLAREGRPERPATLEDRLEETWGRLHEAGNVACLACGEAMAPRWSAGAGVVGGRCGSCGSELA